METTVARMAVKSFVTVSLVNNIRFVSKPKKDYHTRNRNLQASKIPLEGHVQGTSLFIYTILTQLAWHL